MAVPTRNIEIRVRRTVTHLIKCNSTVTHAEERILNIFCGSITRQCFSVFSGGGGGRNTKIRFNISQDT